MLIRQRVRQLVGDDRLVPVLVKLACLAEEPLEERRGLLHFRLRFLDQVHRLGLGIVKSRDFLGINLGERFLEVVVAR